MEERCISISFEKAKEWYKSDNSSLREIALQAFTKEELEQVDLKEIIDLLLNYSYELTTTQKIQLESLKNRRDITKTSASKLLRILATYFNFKTLEKEGRRRRIFLL